MMIGLRREILRTGIKHLDEVMAVKLLVEDGSAAGAVCWDIGKGVFYSIAARTIVLATGDAAGIWPSNSERQRGDGIALALRVGAELVDMEFIQYHPTHCWWPFGVRGSVSESFRAEGGRLLNSLGERFMQEYEPQQMELATRDRISVCIYREILEGRGAPHGGIFASVAHLPTQQIEKRLPVILQKYLNFGIDIRKDPIEIRPQPHYFCGGVKINGGAQTSVQGLYAAGAVSGGVHGANRLGSNSLIDILVFGEIAGRNAAQETLRARKPFQANRESIELEIARIEGLRTTAKKSPVDLPHLRRKHIEMMDRHMGVLRNATGLKTMLTEIARTKSEDLSNIALRDSSREYNFELRDALELFFRLEIEEASTQAALLREESRGCHFREDFPTRDDSRWLSNIFFRKVNGDLQQEVRAVRHSLVSMDQFPEYAQSNSPWHGYTG
jgi:fumarate reductase (CoM/CoB) subunit A